MRAFKQMGSMPEKLSGITWASCREANTPSNRDVPSSKYMGLLTKLSRSRQDVQDIPYAVLTNGGYQSRTVKRREEFRKEWRFPGSTTEA